MLGKLKQLFFILAIVLMDTIYVSAYLYVKFGDGPQRG